MARRVVMDEVHVTVTAPGGRSDRYYRRVRRALTAGGFLARVRRAVRAGAEALKAKEWTEEELDARSALSRRLGLKPDRWRGRRWTAEQDARLGTAPDAVLAGRFGRTERAVRVRRSKLGVGTFDDRRRG